MEYKYENEKTLRISLTFADLQEREIRLVDFLTEQDKVESLFFELLAELGLVEDWDDSEMMSFQIRPNAKGIDILMTDDITAIEDIPYPELSAELEDFLKEVVKDKPAATAPANKVSSQKKAKMSPEEKAFAEAFSPKATEGVNAGTPEQEPDYVYYTIKFDDILNLINLAKSFDAKLEESELYELKGTYFLTALDNQKTKGKKLAMATRARLLEYGEQGEYSRELLREHAKVIIERDALNLLAKI